MKINGINLEKPNTLTLYLPRGEQVIEFKAQAISDIKDFEKICPEPKPTRKRLADGRKVDDIESTTYKQAMMDWGGRKVDWIILKSLEPSKIEWEQVDMSNPDTWNLWKKELKDSHFSEFEVQRIQKLAMDANNLTEERLEEARARFLNGQEEDQDT